MTKKYQRKQFTKGNRDQKPLPKVNVDFAVSGDEMTADKMRSLMCNPIYTGIAQFPAIIDDETWVRAAAQMIKKEGAEQFLVNMLYVLRQSWRTVDPSGDNTPE